MSSPWQPFSEPLRRTLVRTVLIAAIAGAVLARWWGGPARWPLAALLAFWFSFGGHWVEVGFLNWLRPRLPMGRPAQIAARVAVWFLGGVALGLGAGATAMLLGGRQPAQWPAWWLPGLALIGVELVVHAVPRLRGQSSFYNGRG